MSDTMTEEPAAGRPWSGLPHPFSELHRSEDDRWIAGVCGGIARHFDVPTWIIRLVAFGAGLSGIGIPVYLLAWLLVPGDQSPSVAAAKRWNRNTVVAVSVLVAVASLLAFGPDDVGAPWRATPWILVAAGVFLIFRAGRASRDAAPAPPTTDTTGTTGATGTTGPPLGATPLGDVGGGPVRLDPTTSNPTAAPVPRTPRARSLLTPITLFGVLAFCGAATMAGGRGWARPSVVAAVSLCAMGAVLVIAAFAGRAGGLKVLGVLLAVPLVAAVAVGPRWRDWGDRTYRPSERSQLRSRYELGVGRSTFDLRALPLSRAAGTRVVVDQLIGQVVVWLPPDTTTQLRVDVRAGEVDFDDDDATNDDDRDVDGERHVQRRVVTGDGSHLLTLDVKLGAGQVVINDVNDRVEPSTPEREIAPDTSVPDTTLPASPSPTSPSPTTPAPTTSGGTR